MGYYSELNADEQYWEQHDHSIISPVLQWEWRIEDLISRLEDITGERYGSIALNYQGCRFTDADLAYSPPEFFSRASDIMAAIDIAKDKLIELADKETSLILWVGNKRLFKRKKLDEIIENAHSI